MLNDTWISKYNRMRRDIYIHKTIRSNHNIITNGNVPYYCRIDAYPYTISNSWISLSWTTICMTDYHPLMYIAISTYLCFTVDCDIICMPQIYPPLIY